MPENMKMILQQLEAEKSVDMDTLIEAIRSAIEVAAGKAMHKAAHVSVEVEKQPLSFKVFEIRLVTETVEDPSSEISLEDALKLNSEVVVGNKLKVPAEPANFGRIAAQTARQVIIQKIRDAERERIFKDFKQHEGDLVVGSVKSIDRRNLYVTVGQVEAILPYREQSPRENYKIGDRIRAIIMEVDRSSRGAKVLLSRVAPDLVHALFEFEVPEIMDGTVEIKAIARDAGNRTKIAVASKDSNVDAVGACVGLKGARVRAVVEELNGEKIDVIRWNDDPLELCINALNPADILDIELNEEMQRIHVQVPQEQLSLAIGKSGQNARLASQLVGWNIDIRGDAEPLPAEEESAPEITDEGGEEAAGEEPAADLSEAVEKEADAAESAEVAEVSEEGGSSEESDASEETAE
ncbi:MAG: transcription termination/antitermination protein NusA [Candidatus Hydrogenedens sp.]|nr:transcription termination/antitermination protein NusA [Candidatus Hydrogenedens sp.]